MLTPAAIAELRSDWRILVACALGIAASAIALPYYSIGALTKPIELETGWSRSDIQFAIAFSSGLGALTAPVTGWLVDRYGARKVALPGFAGVALGMMIAALAGSTVVFYLGFALTALLGAGTNPVVWSKVVTSRFDHARGTALGLALVGTALSAILLPLLITVLVQRANWHVALALVAILPLVVSLPIAWFWLPAEPVYRSGAPVQPAVSIRSAVRSVRFAILAVSILCGYLAVSGVLTSLVPAFTDRGLAPARAAVIAGTVGLAMIPGRVLIGMLIDRYWAPAVGCVILLIPAAACLILVSATDSLSLTLCCLALGLAAGAELDLLAFLTARYFGRARFSKLYALLYAGLAIGSATAPAMFSRLREVSGDYAASFLSSAGLFAVAGCILLLLGPYPSIPDPSAEGSHSDAE
ncbi:MFS transporter [Novosphingobium sp.]|uniref:MFS transporter n=1 Tax=Novosphingobium sp. TaxID=1874826 RepID=UPI001E11DD35|nr:MFS transporter [Novosphingobium sp.]MBX9664287.1 MFS transporter [Novosphingobium sp.]